MNIKYPPSAAELIAAELMDGESVDMGGWSATFADAIYSAVERGDELANKLRAFCAKQVSADELAAYIENAVSDYAERNEADWISAREIQRKDEAIRDRDEERMIRSEW